MKVATREVWRTVREACREVLEMGVLAFLCVCFLASSCRASQEVGETVEVEVLDVRFDHRSNSPVVILQDKAKKKAMPIWIGTFEAQAIAMEMQGVPPPRPLTHDLLKNILQNVGVAFEKAVVSELKGNAYYARIYLASAGKHIEIDSRPSDAIALALRFHRPIFVARSLLERETVFSLPQVAGRVSAERIRGITVQDLTEDLAALFELSQREGVLVSDAGAHSDLHRGDVILAVEDERVQSTADFREKMAKVEGKEVTLRVRREGKELRIKLLP